MGALSWLMNMGFAASGVGAPVVISTTVNYTNNARWATSPFMTPKFGDEASIQAWQGWHQTEHDHLHQAAALKGVPISQVSFDGHIDDPWLMDHVMAHLALESVAPNSYTLSATTLATKKWETEQEFNDWHQTHRMIHSRLAFDLNIVAS